MIAFHIKKAIIGKGWFIPAKSGPISALLTNGDVGKPTQHNLYYPTRAAARAALAAYKASFDTAKYVYIIRQVDDESLFDVYENLEDAQIESEALNNSYEPGYYSVRVVKHRVL